MALNISSGATYVISNTMSGTVMDISDEDNKSVVGCKKSSDSQSQKWTITFVPEHGWHIKNCKTGQYLAFDGEAKDGAVVIVVAEPFTWHLWPDTTNIFGGRICVPSTALNADLDTGSDADGTPIVVWGRWDGKNQVWSFSQVRNA